MVVVLFRQLIDPRLQLLNDTHYYHYWWRGAVVSGVRCMNEVNGRRAWLVPKWVTIFGRLYNLGM